MGNEMGNRNVTGMEAEEDNTAVEATEKSLQDAVKADGVKEENHVVHSAEDKDFLEKVTGLASDSPAGAREEDPHIDSQASEGQDHTELLSPAGSTKAPVESKEAGGKDNEIPLVPLLKDAIGHGKQVESSIEDNQLATADHQVQEQTSDKNEEEETNNSTSDTVSVPHNPEPLESIDPKLEKHEMVKIHDCLSVKDHIESQRGSEEILRSSLWCENEAQGYLFGTEMTNSLAEIVVSKTDPEVEKTRDDWIVKETVSQEEKMIDLNTCEEKFESVDGDDIGNGLSKVSSIASNLPSDAGNKCDEELPTEVNLDRNNSPVSQPEVIPFADLLNSYPKVSEPEDKCMIHTEETKLIENGSENEVKGNDPIPNEVNGNDPIPARFGEESTKELETNEANDSESEFIASDHVRNRIESLIKKEHQTKEAKEAKVTENDDQVDLRENNPPLVSQNCEIEEAKVTENGRQVDLCDNNLTLVSQEHCKDSKEVTEMVSENGTVPTDSTVEDYSDEGEEPAEKNIVKEKVEKAEAAYGMENDTGGKERLEQGMSLSHSIEEAENISSQSPASPAQSQDHKQDTAIGSETVPEKNESTSELKQECCSEFFVTEDSNLNSAILIVDTLQSAVELADEKPAQALLQDVETSLLSAAETEISANQSKEQSQDHKQDTAIGSETVQEKNESTLGLKQECCSEFLVTEDSNLSSAISIVDTLHSAVELADKKPGQALLQDAETGLLAAAETETSASQPNEQCAKTSAYASGGYEADESGERLSTESNPDNLKIHVEMRKSPSFNLDLRNEEQTEDSDQTPLLYQDKAVTKSLPSPADAGFRNPIVKSEYGRDTIQNQMMSAEDKTSVLERSDSEKLKTTPFLGFLKEEEEAHVVVTPHKQDGPVSTKMAGKDFSNSPTKKAASNSPKGRGNRKPRTSLFSNCMCCATVNTL